MMNEEDVTLREFLELRLACLNERLEAYTNEHRRFHDQLATQVQRDADRISEKLIDMNELREQVASERSFYAPRELLDVRVGELMKRIEDAVALTNARYASNGQRISDIERVRANLEGRLAMLGGILLFLSVIINLAISLVGKLAR